MLQLEVEDLQKPAEFQPQNQGELSISKGVSIFRLIDVGISCENCVRALFRWIGKAGGVYFVQTEKTLGQFGQ